MRIGQILNSFMTAVGIAHRDAHLNLLVLSDINNKHGDNHTYSKHRHETRI